MSCYLSRVAATGALLALVASGGVAPSEAAAAAPTGGGVSGRVFFGSQTPPVRKLPVTLDHAVCGAEKTSPTFAISEDHGLANVVVAIQGLPAPEGSAPAASVSIQQDKCEYAPHLQAVQASGETALAFLNHDGLLHNVHGWVETDTIFNFAQPGMLERLETAVTLQNGVVEIRCDVHEWMSAYVVVFDHPYFAITDASGSFTIDGVPPGTYTVTAWHEALGTMEKSVTVASTGMASLDFEILPR